MAKAKNKPALSNEQLAAKIDRIVAIRPVANEYRLLCEDVKDELLIRNIGGFETRDGNTATVSRKPMFTWVLEKLSKVLPRGVFESVCPRKCDTKKLNQRLVACPEDKALAACRTEKPGKPELKVMAKGEVLSTQESEEDVEEAA